jgi:uncharacterized protein (TIRG00374 family)
MDGTSFYSRQLSFFKRPVVSLIIRVLISGVLLAYLVKSSAFIEVARAFSRINLPYLGMFYLLYFLSVGLQALRWKVLLKAWDIEQNFIVLLRRILTGLFMNNFMPSSIGGDAYRLYAGGRDTGKMESVAATIFYERVLSYGTLVTLGLVVLSIRADIASDWLFWLLLMGMFFALTGIIAISTLPAFAMWAENFAGRFPFADKLRLKDWLYGFRFKLNRPDMLASVFLLSFLLQLSDVFSFYVVGSAIQLHVKYMDLLLFVPLLYLATLLPVSVNGIGIRESVFVLFASSWQITSADAVAYSLTVFALNLGGSLVGGVIYWFDRPAKMNKL